MKHYIIGVLLTLPLAAQVEIRYSRQSDPIVKAIVGTVPKGVAIYRADVVNIGTSEARMFPSRVGFEAAAEAPMQDPEAAVFAAQHYKDTRWWVVALRFTGQAAKYAGPAALLLGTSGVALPAVVTGIAGGIGGTSSLIDGASKDAAKLTIPATWLRDGMPEIVLRPGEPVPYLLALGGTPPETFMRTVGVGTQPQPLPNGGITLTPAPMPSPPSSGARELVPSNCYFSMGAILCNGGGIVTNPVGVIYREDKSVDVVATIMAARQTQAEYTIAGLR